MKVEVISIICFLLAPTLELGRHSETPQDYGQASEIWVNNGTAGCPRADFQSIQDAVNAAQSGNTIRICQGEYPEQVVVKKSLKLVADLGVVLIPKHMVQNASSLSTSEPLAAAILVSDAEKVDIEGLTVDARNNGIQGCAPRLIGILYQDASGNVAANSLRYVKLPSSLSACRSGNAIEVESKEGGHSKVDIHDNQIYDYQMNGITANGGGTYGRIDENVITSTGDMEAFSWTGIQVAFGARGVIENNTIAADPADVSANQFQSRCDSNSVGVLVFESSGVSVDSNSIQSVHSGIFLAGNRTKISGNTFHNYDNPPTCSAVRGITILGDENEITDNELPRHSDVTLFIRGKKNIIQRNQVAGGLPGIIEVADPLKNLVSDNPFLVPQSSPHELSIAIIPEPKPSR